MSEPLKACPFCGAFVANLVMHGGGTWTVECDLRRGGCGVVTAYGDREAAAITRWNRRSWPTEEALARLYIEHTASWRAESDTTVGRVASARDFARAVLSPLEKGAET